MKFIFPLILFSNLAFSQSNFFLSLISQKLKSYHSFQIEGNYKAYNANGILYNYDFEIVGKKVPTDSTAGFYYIIKSYEKSDSTVSIYCDNVAYIRDKNNYFEITKSENPEYFKDVEHNNGITPAVHKSSSVYKCMPFSFAAYIAALNTHKDLIVTQLKDTIINQKAGLCFEVTVEASKCVNCGKYELILSKKDYSLIKYMKGSNVSGEIVNITNSKLDIEVKTDIFYQEVQKIKSKKSTQNTPVKQNMEGKIAPEWNLPVYGKNITKKLSDFKGKYMLLEFTATNCAACGKALEVMKRLESK
ncbi:MAG: hypothetical protein SFY32_07695, partial [Bacteroidota bacterium]|nr:hypothetical protein [Bacteroidota bacterium]